MNGYGKWLTLSWQQKQYSKDQAYIAIPYTGLWANAAPEMGTFFNLVVRERIAKLPFIGLKGRKTVCEGKEWQLNPRTG